MRKSPPRFAPAAAREPPRRPTTPGPSPPLTLPIGHLKPGKMQPRTSFEDIDALVESVKEFGLLQPILVRPVAGPAGVYEIVAGERRWRAAQTRATARSAGRGAQHGRPGRPAGRPDREPAARRPDGDRRSAGLSPPVEDFKQSHDEIARTVGKSRPHVANTVRLLDLPGAVQEMVRKRPAVGGASPRAGRLARSAGHGRAGAAEQLTVRALERMAGDLKGKPRPRAAKPEPAKSADTRALEKRIEEALGLKADSSCAGWASRACSPWRSATSTSSMPSSTG